MLIQNLLMLSLTAFISVNGQLVEVETDSEEYYNYTQSVVTDIGSPDYIQTLSEIVEATAEPTVEPTTEPTAESTVEPTTDPDAAPTVEPTEAPNDTVLVVDNDEEVALLTNMVELLAENSDSATGTVNSTILTLMDRMVNNFPSYYKYAGFRTSSSDSYSSTLYISKDANVSGSTITFGTDCIAVDFYRVTTDNYNGYIVYNVSDSPGASVNINNNTIVYTNALDGYPSLGTKSIFTEEWLWIGLLAVAVIIIFTRRNN